MKLAMVPQQKLRSRARTALRVRASDGPSARAPIKYATQAKAWAKFPRPFGPSAPSEARNLRAVRGLDTSVSNETFPGSRRTRPPRQGLLNSAFRIPNSAIHLSRAARPPN